MEQIKADEDALRELRVWAASRRPDGWIGLSDRAALDEWSAELWDAMLAADLPEEPAS